MKEKNSRRGLVALGILAAAALLTAGAFLTLGSSGDSRPRIESPQDRLATARRAFSNQDFTMAEEVLRPIAEVAQGEIENRLFYGRVLLELGRLGKARAIFDAVHKEQPDTADAVVGLGQVHERQGQLDLAIACFRRASEMKKEDARIFRLLGLAQDQHGDSIAALFSYRQSLRLLPGQEDLSKRMSEIGESRQPRRDLAGTNARQQRGFDPFEMPDTRPPDPWEGLPRPGFTDPSEGTPRPGRGAPR